MNEILRGLSVPSTNGPALPAAYNCELTVNYLMVTFVALADDDLFNFQLSPSFFSYLKFKQRRKQRNE